MEGKRMSSEDDWLAELRHVYEMDKARQQAKEKRQAEGKPEVTPEQLLKRCRAHELMRQVQKTLLNGEGRLQFYEDVSGYERAVVLMWKGPISAAAKPANIEDVEGSIIVGATAEGIFVNDNELSEVTPEALRQTLLELARGFVTDEKP
jgi:hypothetical protein